MADTGKTPEQRAMWAATVAVRKILAQAKNPRTIVGKAEPTVVAYHVALAAVVAYRKTLEAEAAK